MRTIFLFAFLVTYSLCFSQINHKTEGLWEGKLNAGVELRIVFHIQQNNGVFSATMDSPDQNANGIPCSKVTVTNDSIIIELDVAHAAYKAKQDNDTTLTGLWQQGTASLPLVVHKVNAISVSNRPQTPKPPYPYNSEDVEYDNADKSVHFGATITYPKEGSNFPAAILITGSGQQDRDETLFDHKPFAVIADYLTKKGFAILRVDDRGKGKTTGDVNNATSKDFADDVEASLLYLQTRKEINLKKIGLIGHSEGGLIADLVAAKNKNIAFVIMLAGPGEKGSVLMAEQTGAILQSVGVNQQAAASYQNFYLQILNHTLTEKDSATAFAKTWTDYKQWEPTIDSSIRKQLQITSDEDSKKAISSIIHKTNTPWFTYFLKTDPQDYIKQFQCKVLALNGDKDVQVIANSNLAGIEAALKQSHSPAYETHKMKGLNHLFQHCKTCSPNEYGQLEETFAPEALQMMADWLSKNVQ